MLKLNHQEVFWAMAARNAALIVTQQLVTEQAPLNDLW